MANIRKGAIRCGAGQLRALPSETLLRRNPATETPVMTHPAAPASAECGDFNV
jgi:hypothetical protein